MTCPLEVLKTRLQSSTGSFYPPRLSDVARKVNSSSSETFKGPAQKRDLCTSILRKRSQVSVTDSTIVFPNKMSFVIKCCCFFSTDYRGCAALWNIVQLTIIKYLAMFEVSAHTPHLSYTAYRHSLIQHSSISIFIYRLIVETEGSRALFKGLGPNIIGVAPSRAIYFCAYSQTKASLNKIQ